MNKPRTAHGSHISFELAQNENGLLKTSHTSCKITIYRPLYFERGTKANQSETRISYGGHVCIPIWTNLGNFIHNPP